MPPALDEAHQRLLDALDIAAHPKPFRNPLWKPSARRNKNVKQIVSESSRKESGTTTPNPPPPTTSQPSAQGRAAVTYTNVESAPSLHPAHQKRYCDITGLPAPYTDPKTRLRYHNKEVFGVIRGLGPGAAEQYLETRGAHTILK